MEEIFLHQASEYNALNSDSNNNTGTVGAFAIVSCHYLNIELRFSYRMASLTFYKENEQES